MQLPFSGFYFLVRSKPDRLCAIIYEDEQAAICHLFFQRGFTVHHLQHIIDLLSGKNVGIRLWPYFESQLADQGDICYVSFFYIKHWLEEGVVEF